MHENYHLIDIYHFSDLFFQHGTSLFSMRTAFPEVEHTYSSKPLTGIGDEPTGTGSLSEKTSAGGTNEKPLLMQDLEERGQI